MSNLPSNGQRTLFGLLGIVAIVLIFIVTGAVYQGALRPSTSITVEADRAGLGLVRGSRVNLLGVKVGSVAGVRVSEGGGAVIDVKIDNDRVSDIPAGTSVSIDASTLFGPKSVTLNVPDRPSARHIESGDTLRTTAVSAEFNDLYQNLTTLLQSVDASSLETALSSVATALDGRGKQLGETVRLLDVYLTTMNRALPALRSDLRLGSKVATQYAAVAPDLMKTVGNLSTTGATIVDLEPTLHAFLLGITSTSQQAGSLVANVGEPVVRALSLLRPTTGLLALYAPEFTCTIRGLRAAGDLVDSVSQGGLKLNASIMPGQAGYKYPRDLPQLVKGLGPDCYHMPADYQTSKKPIPRYRFNDGAANVWGPADDSPSIGNPPFTLYDSFFGPTLADLLTPGTGSPQ